MRILIAEDEIATARALKLMLEKNKHSVDIVHNGNDAWNYINMTAYEVIVLDIMMPGMSGMEVLSLIRKNHMRTPVLLLTAKSEIEDRVAGLEAGADDYLPKPFASREFIARVNALGRDSVSLTNKEFQLVELFITHPGYVFSTEHLMDKIWGYDSESNIDVVWTHIGYLRKKLRTIKANVEIRTIRGAGYAMEVISC